MGECRRCGAEFEKKAGAKYCIPCRPLAKAEKRSKRKNKYVWGICRDCGLEGIPYGKYLCDECREKNKKEVNRKKNIRRFHERFREREAMAVQGMFMPWEYCWLRLMVAIMRECDGEGCEDCIFLDVCDKTSLLVA